MHIKKLSALLLALMLTAALVSCGTSEPSETGTETAPAESSAAAETVLEDAVAHLPEKDLDGFALMLGKQPQAKIAWSNISFAVSEESGEVLNDAIVKRNRDMEEKYNFALVETVFDDPLNTMKQQILAGGAETDTFLIQLDKLKTAATAEYLKNWYDVPNVELAGSWWDQDMQRDLDLGGGMFFMNGDVIFTVYDCVRVIFYSKNLAADFKLENKYGGFYDLVTDGKWTVDLMYEMMETAAADLNGDGVMDYRDRFGLLYNTDTHQGLVTSQDYQLVTLRNGKPVINVFTEKFTEVYKNVMKIDSGVISFNYNVDKYPGLTAREAIVTLFDNKQALFFENGMSAAAQYMRNVEKVDFGFLPLPKFDEAQEKYYSYSAVSAPVLSIPVTVKDNRLENIGFILEALCRESSESVVPVYFDICFSAKYSRDERSYDMIVLATDSLRYDLGIIYDYGGLASSLKSNAEANNENIASVFESIRPAAEKAIRDYHG